MAYFLCRWSPTLTEGDHITSGFYAAFSETTHIKGKIILFYNYNDLVKRNYYCQSINIIVIKLLMPFHVVLQTL